MAGRTFNYLSYTTQVDTTSTTFADASNGGLVFTPADNTTTVVITSTRFLGNSTSASRRPELRLRRTSGTAKSFNAPIPQVQVASTEVFDIATMAVEAWGASPGSQTYQIQTATQNALATTSSSFVKMISIELGANDKSSSSYNSRTTTTSSTFVDTSATITFTPATTGDYILIACADIDNSNNNTNATWSAVALNVDGTQYATKTYHGLTNTSSNIWNWGAVKKVNLSNASHTVSVQYKSNGGTATTGANNVSIIALRADDFDNVFYDETTARNTTTSGSYQVQVTSTHTPQAVNYVIFSSGIYDMNVAATVVGAGGLKDDAGTRFIPSETTPNTFAPDSASNFYLYSKSLANTSTTLEADYASDGTNTVGFAQAAIAWIQLDATPAGNKTVNVFDSVNVSESVTALIKDNVNVFDSINVSESVTVQLVNTASVVDNATIAETVTVREVLLVNVFDSIQVSEYTHPTRGPIDFDAASSSAYQAALSSYSWSHTTAGSNRLLLVGISIFAVGTVSSITYNGVNLSFLRADTNGLYRTELWFLAAPALGANTIAVTLSTSLTSIGNAVSYIGTDQSTPIENSDGGTGTGNPATDAITTFTDLDWTVNAISTSDTAITAGQTERANNTGALGSGAMEDQASISPAGVVTMTWTGIGALDTWAMTEAAIKPVSTATTTREVEVNDNITISESITSIVPSGNANIFDSITISESTTPQKVNTVNVFDSIQVSESVTASIPITANVFDSVTIAESTTPMIVDNVNVFDSVNVSESVTVFIPTLTANVFDSVNISESITPKLVSNINVFDNITVAETITPQLVNTASVFDSVQVSESVTPLIPSGNANVVDNITISEVITIIEKNLLASVVDNITVSENLSVAAGLNIVDNITVSESITIKVPTAFINVFDSIQVSENISGQTVRSISVVDNIRVSENISGVSVWNASVIDSIIISEQIGIHRVRYGWSANWTPESENSTDWAQETQNSTNWTPDSENSTGWKEIP